MTGTAHAGRRRNTIHGKWCSADQFDKMLEIMSEWKNNRVLLLGWTMHPWIESCG